VISRISAVLVFSLAGLEASTVLHTLDAQAYRDEAALYPMVGKVGGSGFKGSGVLIVVHQQLHEWLRTGVELEIRQPERGGGFGIVPRVDFRKHGNFRGAGGGVAGVVRARRAVGGDQAALICAGAEVLIASGTVSRESLRYRDSGHPA
jgi:hypothetical protein